MEAMKMGILNPKAMQLLKGMQDLILIKMRRKSTTAPSLLEISKLVDEVRTKRYAKDPKCSF